MLRHVDEFVPEQRPSRRRPSVESVGAEPYVGAKGVGGRIETVSGARSLAVRV